MISVVSDYGYHLQFILLSVVSIGDKLLKFFNYCDS